jgi:hypothetical protein
MDHTAAARQPPGRKNPKVIYGKSSHGKRSTPGKGKKAEKNPINLFTFHLIYFHSVFYTPHN